MNIWNLNVSFIFYVSFALIIWFRSDIVETVAKLTRTQKFFIIDEFFEYKLEIDAMATYPDFLYGKYPGYGTKLLSCPVCLTFWSTLIYTFIIWRWPVYPIVAFPINYCLSLSIYLLIRKLL